MALNKAKKISVWCSSKPIPLHIGQSGLKNGDKIGNTRYPSWIRCSKCNKRLRIRWTDCDDWGGHVHPGEKGVRGCWHGSLPPHKKTVKVLARGKK